MRTMSVTVAGSVVAEQRVRGVAREHVDSEGRTAFELAVRIPDSGVDDVGVDPRSGKVVGVRRVQRKRALVDAIETPCRTSLGYRLDLAHLSLNAYLEHARFRGECLR